MKKVILFLLVLFSLSYARDIRVVMVIANNGFRDEELFVTKRVLEDAGVKVVVASDALSTARGMLGGKFKPDMLYKDIDPSKFDGIIFVGGIGASVFWNDKKAHEIAREFFKKKKLVAAICIAPVTLAKAGILNGRRGTVWPSEGRTLERYGCKYTGRGVEVDGFVVTAAGPRFAKDFANEILRILRRR